MVAPALFWYIVTFLFGICIGSFLNVVIYRLPIGGSLVKPEHSYCPNCNHSLSMLDLVPLFSFLLLGRRCRYCKKPISWRYFSVELLTGIIFLLLTWRFLPAPADCVFMLLFAAVLIPIFFTDLDTFTIPDSLNVTALVIAVGRDIYGITMHEPAHALLWGWLPRSVVGALVGALIFGLVRLAGWLWKRREAMGLGDPLLARALGAMLISVTPIDHNILFLFPIWVLLSTFTGVIIGVGQIMLRSRSAQAVPAQLDNDTELPAEESSLGLQIQELLYCLLLGDLFDYLKDLFRRKKQVIPNNIEEVPEAEWSPEATAIPFGPFLILGFLLTLFFGNWITLAYLAYALPKSRGEG